MTDLPTSDLGAPVDLAAQEISVPVFAEITFADCPRSAYVGGRARCTGSAPLTITLVPIAPAGVERVRWSAPGSTRPDATESSPRLTWDAPGSYEVMLILGGAAGSASAVADIEVSPVGLGGGCDRGAQCSSGFCLCDRAARESDGGTSCAVGLSTGLCSRTCSGGGCGPGEVCADLSRSAGRDPRLLASPWRRALCLPSCATAADCPGGLACLLLPGLEPGAMAGGPYSWRRGCFAELLGEVGAPCRDAEGDFAGSACLSGLCAPLGARGLCTLDCARSACPADAACATFRGDPQHPLCLRRCDAKTPCTDPLLACEAPLGDGPFGFTVAPLPPKGTALCAPRRCAKPADCAPAGDCPGVDGGAFCTRS